MQRNTPHVFILTAAILASPMLALAQATPLRVTLRYDDSKNPVPFEELYYCANFDPVTGEYRADWRGFQRLPLFDDGQHRDGAAGDGVWGAVVAVTPRPGQLFEWSVDADSDPENGWLGPCPPFVVESTEAVVVEARSMPEEAYTAPSAIADRYGLDLSSAGPPRIVPNTDYVLFTHRAPEAERVYLAGSFNEWARNDGGAIRDGRSAMHPVGNGVWYRLLRFEGEQASYKFVVEDAAGEFHWTPDANVTERDGDDNSTILRSTLQSVRSAATATNDPGQVTWRPFAESTLEELLRQQGHAMVYVRIPANERCRDFERSLLLGEDAAEKLAGSTLLHADASNPSLTPTLRDMGVLRVPSLAWKARNGEWRVFVHQDDQSPELFHQFLQSYRDEVSP